MSHVALALLGACQITCDGQPVSGLLSAKGRALLAYLAVEAHRPHPREVVAELLWPDRAPQVARDSLRQALAMLRLALGERTAAVPVLLITRDTLQFNAAGDAELDVAAFSALLAACATHPHAELARCAPCMHRLQQAATLYRGDFLDQFTAGDSAAFEEWAALHRERLRRQALEVLAHLAAYHERRGDYAPARAYAERQVELDSWGEEAHRQVMRVLALSGQRRAALDHYERCRRLLAEELGVDPAAETAALAAQIRAGALAEPTSAAGRKACLPVQLTSFIGREEERAALAGRLADPGCRLVTLTGPGGVGKTRLALQVAADLEDAFADGVAFVDLASVADPDLVAASIAESLEVKAGGGQPLLAALTQYLHNKHLLLVLDNFEQVLAAGPVVAELLQAAPRLKVVLTSRVVVGVYGEQLVEVPPLSCADPEHLPPGTRGVQQLVEYAAIRLFVERARALQADFVVREGNAAVVAAICRRLDGLPLAIELAAARIRLFPPRCCWRGSAIAFRS